MYIQETSKILDFYSGFHISVSFRADVFSEQVVEVCFEKEPISGNQACASVGLSKPLHFSHLLSTQSFTYMLMFASHLTQELRTF